MNHLFRFSDHFIAAAERVEEVINMVDSQPTAFQKVEDACPLADGSVVERHHPVTTVCMERT